MEIFDKLRAPFSPDEINWRVARKGTGSNGPWIMVLAYKDARAVMERLDSVLGPANWKDTYRETESGRVICSLSLKILNEWITKEDGAGDTNIEGEKGGLSDAFKRASTKWGIGRYLYNLDTTFANIVENRDQADGQTTIDNKRVFWQAPPLPKWALPDGESQNPDKPPQTPPETPDSGSKPDSPSGGRPNSDKDVSIPGWRKPVEIDSKFFRALQAWLSDNSIPYDTYKKWAWSVDRVRLWIQDKFDIENVDDLSGKHLPKTFVKQTMDNEDRFLESYDSYISEEGQ